MKTVKCAICGKLFDTSETRKYCSLSCSEAGRKLRRMIWKEENPAYMADYMRAYRRKKRGELKSGRPYTD